MIEKLKVSREVAEAIDWVKDNTAFENAMFIQISEEWEDDALRVLNNLKAEELARSLIVGYEIEETPEEKILKMYQSKNDGRLQSDDMKWINDAYANGIVYTLETLGIKIKGVND